MQIIIRTTENGKTIPSSKVLEKRRAAQQQFLNHGVQYLEVEGKLGYLNAMGSHVTEAVYIIEPCVEVNYV